MMARTRNLVGGVGLIRARDKIQQLRYGERQEVGEQRRGLRRGLTSGVLLKRVSGAQLTTVATARQRATLASGACRFVRFTEVLGLPAMESRHRSLGDQMRLVTSGTSLGGSVHDDPGAGRSGVGLIRARGGIQRLRYGERRRGVAWRRGGVAWRVPSP